MVQAADANGIPRLDESDAGTVTTFSGLLNRCLDWVSAAMGATGPAQSVAFSSGWSAYQTSQHELIKGEVEVTVAAASSGSYGDNAVIATLPAGRRPRRLIYITAIYAGQAKEMRITTAGQIIVNNAGNGGVAFTTTFKVA